MAPKYFVSNENVSIRLFQSDLLELFTHMHWFLPLIVFVPVVFYFFHKAVSVNRIAGVEIFFLFLLGMLVWTFTEYVMHRFVFHYEPKSKFGRQLHFLLHGIHHDYPNDSRRLVMPPAVSVPLSIFFYFAYLPMLGPKYVAPFFAGFILGYIGYDMIHYATHHAPMKSPLARWLKHNHLRHHYQTDKLGYGVTSPLWDYMFATRLPSKNQRQATLLPIQDCSADEDS